MLTTQAKKLSQSHRIHRKVDMEACVYNPCAPMMRWKTETGELQNLMVPLHTAGNNKGFYHLKQVRGKVLLNPHDIHQGTHTPTFSHRLVRIILHKSANEYP